MERVWDWDPTEIQMESSDLEFEAGVKDLQLTLDEEFTELNIDI